mmetsp:Transcript_21535/g.31287  ORF Transcript_21535/g.31287 Transcript_21535/m.31287 type:complete len:870 (+) Transcript_21535:112-2721(+)|eukprot:CAMPEP_0185035878 /NCGR_PEP_ID=MMETSP1103-20130426/27960_1 /TAXON_ID=36769 /ORGANISM="Paraphysomonas bandaiensis, Strain Caron Lab Isolate" /LENGTH=869 /DNA_ID=CAMNT_0027573157 /DNA_START=93 /DNA_END=2702 /DNA_ORIENTATION=+
MSLFVNIVMAVVCMHCSYTYAAQRAEESRGAKYFQIPMHEVIQSDLYIGMTQFGEYSVTYSGKGADLRPDDYITHADNIKLLTGNLQDFLESGIRETVVPIVDDEDVKYGGQRLLGFVMIQSVIPRKLSMRRGEIEYDMEEGGPEPLLTVGNIVIGQNGEMQTNADEYVPPPHGGGKCITSRDCYNFNGTCSFKGECVCGQNQTGSYCQLYKSERLGLSGIAEAQKHKNTNFQKKGKKVQVEVNPDVPKPPPEEDTFIDVDSGSAQLRRSTTAENNERAADTNENRETKAEKKPKPGIRKKKPGKPKPGEGKAKKDSNSESPDAAASSKGQSTAEKEKDNDLRSLYGPDGVYPEPYLAGKIPGNMAHEREKKRRTSPTSFMYSVRFRTGPIGVAFDNKQPSASIVESVLPNMQAQQSDVQKGDRLVAINEINTTTAPPKVTTRILQSLPWPIVLVFETAPPKVDVKRLELESAMKRTFNMTIIYPPTFTAEIEVRLAEWTPKLDIIHEDACTFYQLRTPPNDVFGCSVTSGQHNVPSESIEILNSRGQVSEEIERMYPMQVLLSREAAERNIGLKSKSLSLMKRGSCTFVDKAKGLVSGGADLGVIINTDDTMIDIPAGKENTTTCSVPLGIIKQKDGDLLHIAGMQNEVLAVVSDPQYGVSPSCTRLVTLAEDVLDKWAHSVPHVKPQDVISFPSPSRDNLRGRAEEGGRIAISGKNGWAFFDYHLALFGPEEVPLGPHRLQMAIPPHGCDPSAYEVRISGTIVAILRGGGCSFGIKVINAQKLGAKAVIIVNTDDKKTMRLMALPDEEPLINIPCIMVSRRIQFYLEQQLKFYHPIDQHIVSIQPTGVFGMYEERNVLNLPQRLPGM